MLKNVTKFVALFLVAIVITPAFALANGDSRNKDFDRGQRSTERQTLGSWVTNEFGVRVLNQNNDSDQDQNNEDKDKGEDNNKHDDKDKGNRGLHLGQFKDRGFFPNMFYNGTVTATSNTGFTIETKDDTTFVVDADSAKIIQIPRTVIALGDINVGDTVHITGEKTSETAVNASVVYVMPANLSPAIAKGTITAVTDDTMTVQTGDDTTITVNTDNNTEIVDSNNNLVDQADVEVGTKSKLIGLWDSVLNVFNAIKIKLF